MIGEINILDEIGKLGVSAAGVMAQLDACKNCDELVVNINSIGGDVLEGMAIANAIRSSGKPTTAKIHGICASIATAIACSCDKIEMPENAYFVVHNPFIGAVGEAEDMRKTADLLDKMKATLVGIYARKTGKDEAELSGMMNTETWLTGSEAKAAGFIDVCLDAVQIAASIDPRAKWACMPEGAKALVRQPENIQAKIDAAIADYQCRLNDAVATMESLKSSHDMAVKSAEELDKKACDLGIKLSNSLATIAEKDAEIARIQAKYIGMLGGMAHQPSGTDNSPKTWIDAIRQTSKANPTWDGSQVWDHCCKTYASLKNAAKTGK